VTVVPQISAPAFLTLGVPSDGEETTRSRLIVQLSRARYANLRQEAYYEGSRVVRDLGIAIPPHLRDLEAVASWPETVVDVIDERVDWKGWYTPDDDLALDAVFAGNHLNVEVAQAVLDSLICGWAPLTVGTGRVEDGEPEVLVKAESPNRMTATWDPRLRRATEALIELYDNAGRLYGWKLYNPLETVTMERRGGRVVVTDRDQHGMGRVPVSVLINRPRSSRPYGRSEITRAIRSLTDSGMRTLLGMEVSREFYGGVQRYLMGADESMFVDQDGNRKSMWDAVMSKVLIFPRDDNGEVPTPGQFTQASPLPFTELLKTYAQMASSASGVPAHHFGFTTDNPASADAIREANGRLDKRSVKRCQGYDQGLTNLGENVVLWRDGLLPVAGSVRSRWSDPSTPTPAAAADRAQKLVAAGILPADSDVTLEELGFSDDQIRRIRVDRARAAGRVAVANLGAAAAAARAGTGVGGVGGGAAAG
jgi:hypothetical protein